MYRRAQLLYSVRSVVFGLGLIALAAPGGLAADASKDASKLPGGTWASIAQLPDFNGVWEMSFGGRRGGGARRSSLRSLPPMPPCSRLSRLTLRMIPRRPIVSRPECRGS